MLRRPAHRVFAVLIAAAFVLFSTEPGAAFHHCPMHDGVLAEQMPGAPAVATPPHGPGAAHGAMPHMPGMPHGPAHHGCTCLGDCAAPPPLPAARVAAAVLPSIERSRVRFAGYGRTASAARFVLPLPTGPPARV